MIFRFWNWTFIKNIASEKKIFIFLRRYCLKIQIPKSFDLFLLQKEIKTLIKNIEKQFTVAVCDF